MSETSYTATELEAMTVTQLKDIANGLGVSGTSSMTKAELVTAIEGAQMSDGTGTDASAEQQSSNSDLTDEELQTKAEQAGIENADEMSREELIAALDASGGGAGGGTGQEGVTTEMAQSVEDAPGGSTMVPGNPGEQIQDMIRNPDLPAGAQNSQIFTDS